MGSTNNKKLPPSIQTKNNTTKANANFYSNHWPFSSNQCLYHHTFETTPPPAYINFMETYQITNHALMNNFNHANYAYENMNFNNYGHSFVGPNPVNSAFNGSPTITTTSFNYSGFYPQPYSNNHQFNDLQLSYNANNNNNNDNTSFYDRRWSTFSKPAPKICNHEKFNYTVENSYDDYESSMSYERSITNSSDCSDYSDYFNKPETLISNLSIA